MFASGFFNSLYLRISEFFILSSLSFVVQKIKSDFPGSIPTTLYFCNSFLSFIVKSSIYFSLLNPFGFLVLGTLFLPEELYKSLLTNKILTENPSVDISPLKV